jgi:hypothetical protein
MLASTDQGAAIDEAASGRVANAHETARSGGRGCRLVGYRGNELRAFNMPFVFRDSKHVETIIDGSVGGLPMAQVTGRI